MNSAPKGKMIAAGMIGNVLEWYDFAIYGCRDRPELLPT